jgi:hypothetical protein
VRCVHVLALLVFLLPPHARANSLDGKYSEAVELCASLAPVHESELGNDPDEVAWWYRGARLRISTAFWNRFGIAYLERRLRSADEDMEKVCAQQLLAEARARKEMPPQNN